MGNKDDLASRIVAATRGLAPGAPLIDMFGGMCSVAGAMAPTGRHAWANDVQHFAVLAARCLLTTRRAPPDRARVERALAAPYRRNLAALRERFGSEASSERTILRSDAPSSYLSAAESWSHIGNDEALASEAAVLRSAPQTFPYRLASITFAWGYFGLTQAMQLDSLRYAIDIAQSEGALTGPDAAWCRLALLGAASRVASAPGHFAQFLRGETEAGLARVKRQRRRAAWDQCLSGLERLRPFGTVDWRRGNRVFRSDALDLWSRLDRAAPENALLYADPPYSKEHYSRYYHVLETLERYDYPSASGVGRYRADRFRTPFSVRTEVEDAMDRLCSSIAERGWTLMLSYPSSGLLTAGLGLDLNDVLARHFSTVRLAFETSTHHSTLGARHGQSSKSVREFLWIAS